MIAYLEKEESKRKKRGKILNGLIRELLSKEIEHKDTGWLDHCFSLMDQANTNSKGARYKREDLYER